MQCAWIISQISSAPIFRQLFGCSSYPDGGSFLFVASFHQHFSSLNCSLIGRLCEIQKLCGILFNQLFSFPSFCNFKPIVPVDVTILLVFYKYRFGGYRLCKRLGKMITAHPPKFIVHASGELVLGRSSGFEHVVALSLIGALHKNAPLQGPIIMDSPFGRLDPVHKENIVRYLPDMAEQSMLLAYIGEIDAQVAHEALAGHLLHEYHLTRVTSMHTHID